MNLEVCVGNIEDIKIINNLNINRIELNQGLSVGGLTPSISMVKKALELTNIPIVVMVRLRAGNFEYTESEFEIMYDDAKEFLKLGVSGIVFGFLNNDRSIDIEKTKKMIDLVKSYNKEAIFSRAVDVSKNYFESLDILMNLGITRILTSGAENTVFDGLENLKKALAMDAPIIIGGGVRVDNISILKKLGFKEIHGSFSNKMNNLYHINFGDFSIPNKNVLREIEMII